MESAAKGTPSRFMARGGIRLRVEIVGYFGGLYGGTLDGVVVGKIEIVTSCSDFSNILPYTAASWIWLSKLPYEFSID